MPSIRKKLVLNPRITIWGLGYLGYTEILYFQSHGFKLVVWDYLQDRLEQFAKGLYPSKEIIGSWSMRSGMHHPDMDKLSFADNIDKAFESTMHFVCLPSDVPLSVHEELKKIFIKHGECLSDKFIIFSSAGSPGSIEKQYGECLREVGAKLCVGFRQDWVYEEMLSGGRNRILAANNESDVNDLAEFFYSINCTFTVLSSIHAAEVMVHSENVFHALVNAYLNELAMAFPDVNIREATQLMLQEYTPRLFFPTLGNSDIRHISSLRYLASNDRAEAMLSLASVVSRSDVSVLMNYGEMLCSQKIGSVLIIGIGSAQSTPRSIELSPSSLLAEYLNRHKIKVYIHAPAFSEQEIKQVMSFAEVYNNLTKDICVEGVVIMKDVSKLHEFSVSDLKKLGWFKLKIIIDNPAILQYVDFPSTVIYHIPGDGKLGGLWR